MEVREKVLEEALNLFNTKGLTQTSLRDIAQAAGITHGHLRYHFKKTGDTKAQLVQALFDQCELKADQAVADVLQPPFTLTNMVVAMVKQARYFWEFRFLLDHMMEVCQLYPDIQKGMQGMYNRRSTEFMWVFDLLIQEGIMQPDLSEQTKRAIIRHYHLVVDFGTPFTRIFAGEKEDDEQFQEYLEMWMFTFRPFLTEQGRAALTHAVEEALVLQNPKA